MAGRFREPPPRLNIQPPLHLQQPVAFDGPQTMFSPALPTAIHQGFHPPFPINTNSMQTPMQPFFPSHPSAVPGRSTHRAQPSFAQLGAGGIHASNAIPFTPLAQGHFPRNSISFPGVPPMVPHPHLPRNRRQPSIGGPPKAPLGGPARKPSPLPPLSDVQSLPAALKSKKINVALPKETEIAEGTKLRTHPPWARVPLEPLLVPRELPITYPDLTSAELFPPDSWRYHEPGTIDVFLPGKFAWDAIKRQGIEEKLEKLGVERGSGSSLPQIHAPHARAASISSPADPALLYFKLNRLQQAQTMSSLSSVSASPQPVFALPPSPRQLPPRLQDRHSLSFAPPSSLQPPLSAVGPYGMGTSLSLDLPTSPTHFLSGENLHVPQGRIPPTISSLATSAPVVRPDSRPDFARGFGLDIPEEEETQELETINDGISSGNIDLDVQQDGEAGEIEDGNSPAAASQGKLHSRHASRLSATFSLPSVDDAVQEYDMCANLTPLRDAIAVAQIDDLDQDAAGEWTGSEDQFDEESIGEWSNPSDEERARKERAERRMLRRARETEMPRRLPNFPCPPANKITLPLRNNEDIISNPSEEEGAGQPPGFRSRLYSNPSDLPTSHLPHSRAVSGQFPFHGLTQQHSRASSHHLGTSVDHQQQPSLGGRRNSLNPFAKPFVFGSSQDPGPSVPAAVQPTTVFGHAHLPSMGKPLNAAAQEFKPGSFTFCPPPGVPESAFPTVETSRPLPVPPTPSSPVRREKRQRRGSSASYQGEESMDAFKFPNLSDVRRSEPSSPNVDRRQASQTWSSDLHTRSLPPVPQDEKPLSESLAANDGRPGETPQDDSTAKMEDGGPILPPENPTVPSSAKTKRTPVPLNFKHPTSSSTMPAGVFKALVNAGDERTRRSVRSRLSSRDISEHVHRPSLDDTNVPPISQKMPRTRLNPSSGDDMDDIFRPAKHQSSLPSTQHSPAPSSGSDIPVDVAGEVEARRYEQQLRAILDEKIETIRLHYRDVAESQAMTPTTKTMITDVVSLFRTQLQESASRGLDDSQMDARGELDFELIKDLIQQGHAEVRDLLRQELSETIEQLNETHASSATAMSPRDAKTFLEQAQANTVAAVAGVISGFLDRVEAVNSPRHVLDQKGLVDELVSALKPRLGSVRSDSVDYEYLTGLLSQAVKPHISQLIDLASDKRETAGLIVDSLAPILQSFRSPTSDFDADAISGQLTSEIRRLIAPIDPFEIKEQVADLVVERLDSRLALRDRTFNADTVSAKVNEEVSRLLQPVHHVASTVQNLVNRQELVSSQNDKLTSLHHETLRLLTDISPNLTETAEALRAQAQVRSGSIRSYLPLHESDVNHIKSTVDSLAHGQESLSHRHEELHSLHKDISERLQALPEALTSATNILHVTHAELISTQEKLKAELDELRKSNADYQTQLAKARTAHGQVRVEKDLLSEKLADVDSERDRLRSLLGDATATADAKSADNASVHARNSELEEALSQALARLKVSDVAAHTSQEQIASLESLNRELVSENQGLKAKVDSLDLKATSATREKQAAECSLSTLQTQYDNISSQQNHWADLRHVSEQMKVLTTLVSQVNDDELNELKHIRDRFHAVEGEHASLQKRFREQENKFADNQRATLVVRQNLTQVQLRASEHERRAKEYESQLEMVQTKLDQAEQIQTQLDADYSLATLQLEEREADHRYTKEREAKLREQVKSLEAKVARLQSQMEHAKKTVVAPNWTTYRSGIPSNGHIRPDSRSNSSFDNRSVTPITQSNGIISMQASPPETSVWDSMHAPSGVRSSGYSSQAPTTPKAQRPQAFFRSSIPSISSPTPSNVSLAPTQGDDGWWGE